MKIKIKLTGSSIVFVILLSVWNINAIADEQINTPTLQEYTVQPGDILEISVWKEEDMYKEILVRPDGGLTFPLAGELFTRGKTIAQLQKALTKRLSKYLSNPVVTISPKQLLGNRIYVIGKVAKPGMYLISSYIDIVQALSMAGGLTPFSAVNDIIVLRRSHDGKQKNIKFRYGDIEDGDDLEQNILLKSGDTVLVP
ncbi:MAG: polysaccharide biosynthesis/export family protein [Gammaproteobacteria bacterium]|nr:polysaccharide biosynthesis/export family protein [Gammaproteobacteria bacterium]